MALLPCQLLLGFASHLADPGRCGVAGGLLEEVWGDEGGRGRYVEMDGMKNIKKWLEWWSEQSKSLTRKVPWLEIHEQTDQTCIGEGKKNPKNTSTKEECQQSLIWRIHIDQHLQENFLAIRSKVQCCFSEELTSQKHLQQTEIQEIQQNLMWVGVFWYECRQPRRSLTCWSITTNPF